MLVNENWTMMMMMIIIIIIIIIVSLYLCQDFCFIELFSYIGLLVFILLFNINFVP